MINGMLNVYFRKLKNKCNVHIFSRSVAIREVLDRMSLTARSQHYEKVLAICEIPNEWILAAKFVKAKVRV